MSTIQKVHLSKKRNDDEEEEATMSMNLVEVTWKDGERGIFHGQFLRDNCKHYFDSHTGQRMKNTLNLAEEAYLLIDAYASSPSNLTVVWKDACKAEFSSHWLRENCHGLADAAALKQQQQSAAPPQLWSNNQLLPPHTQQRQHVIVPTLAYQEMMPGVKDDKPNAQVFLRWITNLRDYGLTLIEGLPAVPGTVMKMAGLISYHRKTHYGDSFSVIAEVKPQHLAYTPVELEVHTDLNYRESSPGIQLLHCLASGAKGGESTFVDGFHVARTMREKYPEQFALLVETPIPFRVQDGPGFHYYKVPTICVDDTGEVVEVHFNERTRGPLELPVEQITSVYEALSTFQRLATCPENTLQLRLKEGDLVAFNNRRILHGRKAFDPRTGRRHLEGCYVDYDEFLTCLRKLQLPPLKMIRASPFRSAAAAAAGRERRNKTVGDPRPLRAAL